MNYSPPKESQHLASDAVEFNGKLFHVSTVDLHVAYAKYPHVRMIDNIVGATDGRYETQVFEINSFGEPGSTLHEERYDDESEALANHSKLVEAVKNGNAELNGGRFPE